ncbi:MAG: amidohydrolase [Firmicutes bacterium]|nr:amidohydrolase [Bacillota bacterium]
MSMQDNYVTEMESLLRDLAIKIWETPELGLKEKKSSALLAETCLKEGFEVKRGIAGMETAFVARWGEGKPVIAFLAEYDALPGMSQKVSLAQEALEEGTPGHGCGHNLLGVGALGAAFALKRSLENTGTAGTVCYFGCPAEETITAKGYMVRDGYFDDVDAVFDWHPADINTVNMKTTLACDSVEFIFKGRSAHAAGNPEWGRSALKAVELMNAGVNYMREHTIEDVRIHYVITDGGQEPNVVPARAAVWYYIRSPRRSQVDELSRRIFLCAEGAATMTETELEIKVTDKCYNMLPNKTLSRIAHEEFEATGVPAVLPDEEKYIEGLRATLTKEQLEETFRYNKMPLDYPNLMHKEILPLEEDGEVSPGSTDAGDVSWKAPLAHVRVACKPVGVPGHSWQAVSAFGSELGMQGMLTAAKVLSRAGWRLIENPVLVSEAKAELENSLIKEPFKLALTPDLQPPVT